MIVFLHVQYLAEHIGRRYLLVLARHLCLCLPVAIRLHLVHVDVDVQLSLLLGDIGHKGELLGGRKKLDTYVLEVAIVDMEGRTGATRLVVDIGLVDTTCCMVGLPSIGHIALLEGYRDVVAGRQQVGIKLLQV